MLQAAVADDAGLPLLLCDAGPVRCAFHYCSHSLPLAALQEMPWHSGDEQSPLDMWLLITPTGLCCAVLCCAVLCCAVLCCAVLCCAVLCCAVLCCVCSCQVLIKAELDSSDAGRPVYLLGESFGGLLSLALAIKLGDYIDRLVLVNPASSFSDSPWPALGPLLAQLPPDVYKFLPFVLVRQSQPCLE
jgi:hypothetical protein